jgi:hypothetical protein
VAYLIYAKAFTHPETPDVNQAAFQMVARSTGQPESMPRITKAEVSRFMSAMGTKGGKVGGKVRASRMTPEERRESASKAARATWAKEKGGGRKG